MINPKRVRLLTEKEYEKGTVIYQMCRDLRAEDNEALIFAQRLAAESGEKLIVNYVIYNYRWTGATARFYDWAIASLQEVEHILRRHNIPLMVTFEERNLFSSRLSSPIPEHIGAVVIDQIPLRFAKRWKEVYVHNHSNVPLYEVDAHNCIPVWELSHKQEFAARTIRAKIHAMLPNYMDPFAQLHIHTANKDILDSIPKINWEEVRANIVCDEDIMLTEHFVPGETAAKKMLQKFLYDKLDEYQDARNDINKDGQSNLSPYISHGNISRRRIVLELLKKTHVRIESAFDAVQNGSNGKLGSIAAFIEECVVRSELCENYCYYNDKYDSYKGFPDWAKETLKNHLVDTREYIYTFKEFKEGRTHDTLWNAAQMQMVNTGKMHGYMRMYWAKKTLEWSKSADDAMKIAVKLNDMYELDGRDPNGYVGCAWSIGGVHDRPWFNRPIFGMVRYMATSGVEKRGNIKEYISKHSPLPKLP
jgi:deoxyribodipyrimidine photo-lyase